MKLKVVYDTNVIVSASLKVDSIPASLVSLAIEQQVRFFYSRPILREYEDVLKRPKFKFTSKTIRTVLKDLRRTGTLVRPTKKVTVSPDEPDNRFLECAQAAKADYLVTGNTKHFPTPEFNGIKIVSPREFARVFVG